MRYTDEELDEAVDTALELARSGEVTRATAILQTLDAEGYKLPWGRLDGVPVGCATLADEVIG